MNQMKIPEHVMAGSFQNGSSCGMFHPHGFLRQSPGLCQAFAAGDVALMECQLAATGEPVAVICAARGVAGRARLQALRWLREVALKKIEPDTGLHHPDGSFNFNHPRQPGG